jgi:hypothetical protein
VVRNTCVALGEHNILEEHASACCLLLAVSCMAHSLTLKNGGGMFFQNVGLSQVFQSRMLSHESDYAACSGRKLVYVALVSLISVYKVPPPQGFMVSC